MSQYAILIYEDPAYFESIPPEGWAGVVKAHNAFTSKVTELGGAITGGGALAPTVTATTIKGGAVTAGPFFTATEALLGYYVIEARDLDQAVEFAKLCPATGGGVELRPIVDPATSPF